MVLQFITWNVNPELFSIGSIQVRWYGLLFASAFFFGYLLFKKIWLNEGKKEELLDQLLMYMALGTIIGARLGHVLFYDFGYYITNPLEILMVWHGGLASHGAGLGILFALYKFSKKYKFNYLWLTDRMVIVVALSGFFIRLGNLMNSEIYGIATNMPWGFIFVREGETIAKHPTQIYEALAYLLIAALLVWFYYKKIWFSKQGVIFGLLLIILFSFRFLIEYIKNPQAEFEVGLPLFMGQILSLPFIFVGIYLMYRGLNKKNIA